MSRFTSPLLFKVLPRLSSRSLSLLRVALLAETSERIKIKNDQDDDDIEPTTPPTWTSPRRGRSSQRRVSPSLLSSRIFSVSITSAQGSSSNMVSLPSIHLPIWLTLFFVLLEALVNGNSRHIDFAIGEHRPRVKRVGTALTEPLFCVLSQPRELWSALDTSRYVRIGSRLVML